MSALQVNAQTVKVADSDLHGVWLMESMQFEGEKKIMCGKCSVLPHEYGTYTYKDGWYSEMGREKRKDAIVWVDKTTTKGTWKTRHDIWKKQTAMPEKLRRYIVDCCKKREMPADMQQLMKENVFK